MDPKDRPEESPLHQPPDRRPVPLDGRDTKRDPEAGSELAASDVVDDAMAKREERERHRDERDAEGGSLSSGIGDDEP